MSFSFFTYTIDFQYIIGYKILLHFFFKKITIQLFLNNITFVQPHFYHSIFDGLIFLVSLYFSFYILLSFKHSIHIQSRRRKSRTVANVFIRPKWETGVRASYSCALYTYADDYWRCPNLVPWRSRHVVTIN